MKNVNNKKIRSYLPVLLSLGLGIGLTASQSAHAASYGQRLCQSDDDFICHRVQRGESWSSLFGSYEDENVARRVNRMNIELSPGMVIAIPKDNDLNVMDASPFPYHIGSSPTTRIIVDQSDLAWGAYNSNGDLVKWGPIAAGKDYCPDVGRSCRTVTGNFTVYTKRGEGCVSSKFPVHKGGAPMPNCMFFHGGFALHGSPNVPGYNASHGCVRLFNEDARWLNQEFVEVGSTRVTVRY
jgi:hypothetical protein